MRHDAKSFEYIVENESALTYNSLGFFEYLLILGDFSHEKFYF